MKNTTTVALFFLAAGIFTSVTVLSAYQIVLAVPLVYYTYLAVKNKNWELPKSSWLLLGFMAVATLSLFLNLDLVPKPGKNFGRLKYFAYGVASIYVLRVWMQEASDKTKKLLVNIFLFSLILAGLYATFNFITLKPGERVKSFTDTMRYGYGSGMILLTILSACLHREKIKQWFDVRMGVATILIGLMGVYFASTRGALLAFACGLPFVLYYYRKTWGMVVGGLTLTGVIVLGSLYFFGKADSTSRFNRENNSDVMRRSQWKAAWIATQEKPILGWGMSNFHTQLKRIKETHNLDEKAYNDAHAHNLFLEISSGTGLLGLFVFLAWLFTWAFEILKSDPLKRALFIPFGVAFIVCSQFEVTFDANNASMIFFIYALSSIKGVKRV